ncbi:class I SAM-dependent methyltransferase [Paracidovorax oryzae]|uniref:class I SAM-dependent methyltransferase n=1 Tax=Paracidovorax oryzae TaxID=862720 RepID=UPI0012EC9813|nr:class I SAM-dependent methyltransferase [Paracidovorax oryzae]
MPDRVDVQYFSQAKLWGQPVHEQVMVARDLVRLIPDDVHTILDAGCGNGAVTNDIAKSWSVVGCDISETALKNVAAPAVVADLCNLPFADDSFDLVLASDVIEHLPDEIYKQALMEISRVAAKYVLIAVPYREVLEAAYVSCPSCGQRYHAHLHQRVYEEASLHGLMGTRFQIEKMLLSGEHWKYGASSLPDASYSVAGLDYPFENAICPYCGTRRGGKAFGRGAESFRRRIEAYQAMSVAYGFEPVPPRSEIIALYTKAARSPQPIAINSEEPYEDGSGIVELNSIPRLKDPVGYPVSVYELEPEGSERLLFLKRSPEKLKILKGYLSGVDSYCPVNEAYHQSEILEDGSFMIAEIPFNMRGFLIRFLGASDDLVVDLEYRNYTSRDEILHLCFQALPGASAHENARIQHLNSIMERLESTRSELENKLQIRDKNYEELQERFEKVNALANSLESERVRLNELLAERDSYRIAREEEQAKIRAGQREPD